MNRIIYRINSFSKRNRLIKPIRAIGVKLYFELNDIMRYFFSSKKDFQRFYNIAHNRRCFIIGNGPSLSISDLEKIKNEDSFATNRIYKIFGQTDWRPTYYCSHDTKVLSEIINDLDSVLSECKCAFINSCIKRSLKYSGKNVLFFYGIQDEFYPKMPDFSYDVCKGIYEGFTVVYTCIQLALYMGYSEIYLLGVDHNYSLVRMADGSIKTNAGVVNYMNGIEGANYYLPQLEKTELAYRKAKEVAINNGIRIMNATRGGKLEIFDRIDFDELID